MKNVGMHLNMHAKTCFSFCNERGVGAGESAKETDSPALGTGGYISHPCDGDDVRSSARAGDDLVREYEAVLHPHGGDGDGDDRVRHAHVCGCDAPRRDGHTLEPTRLPDSGASVHLAVYSVSWVLSFLHYKCLPGPVKPLNWTYSQ